jgi:hypothetical protein
MRKHLIGTAALLAFLVLVGTGVAQQKGGTAPAGKGSKSGSPTAGSTPASPTTGGGTSTGTGGRPRSGSAPASPTTGGGTSSTGNGGRPRSGSTGSAPASPTADTSLWSPTSIAGKDLIDKLEKRGTAFSKADIVVIGQDKSGMIVWLEKGNSKAGLEHLWARHAKDFGARGLSKDKVPQAIMQVLAAAQGNNEKLANAPNKKTGRPGGYTYVRKYNGNYMVVGVGSNGFITTSYPTDEKKAQKLIQKLQSGQSGQPAAAGGGNGQTGNTQSSSGGSGRRPGSQPASGGGTGKTQPSSGGSGRRPGSQPASGGGTGNTQPAPSGGSGQKKKP